MSQPTTQQLEQALTENLGVEVLFVKTENPLVKSFVDKNHRYVIGVWESNFNMVGVMHYENEKPITFPWGGYYKALEKMGFIVND